MIPPVVWRTVFAVAVAALLLGNLLASSPFPAGADPGHMLALSYALEGEGPEGELGYAPALPALMLVARRVADGDMNLLFWLVKALGLLCLLAEALGLAALAGSVAGRSAAHWTFVLALWNPNSWNQLLWGGYAQMLAIGLGGCALALGTRGRYLPSGALLGAVVLTHPYSSIFFGAAAFVLFLSQRQWRALGAAVVAVLVALPSLSAYSHFFGELRFGRTTEAYAISVAEVAQNIMFHPAINILMGVLLVLAILTRKEPFTLLWPLLVGCGALFIATPPLHVARAGLFAWHGVVLFMGTSFARSGASRLVIAVLCLTPIVSYFEWTTLVRDYAPLERRHAEAMMTLASVAEGRVLIVSPTPNVDGWWYEGLTGKPALIGDDLRWALLQEQQERSVAAQTITHATHVQNGGPIRLLTLELPGAKTVTSVWARDIEYFPLIEKAAPHAGEVLLTPAPGVRFHRAVREGDSIALRCEFLYDAFRFKGFTRDLVVDVTAEAGWSANLSTTEVRIQGRNLTLRFRPSRLRRSTWRARSIDDLLTQWNVSHVWVRGTPKATERFELDDRFEKMWERGGVTVFRTRR